MALKTIPLDIQPDVLTSEILTDAPDVVPVAPATMGLLLGTAALAKGRIWGVRAFKHDAATPKVGQTGGNVTVVLFKDVGYTEELFRQTLDFTSAATVTVQFASAIRCFEQPFFQLQGDATSAGDYVDVTLDVEAMG